MKHNLRQEALPFLFSKSSPFTNEKPFSFIDEEEAPNHLQKPWVKKTIYSNKLEQDNIF
jgi:hypothetical protein